jgi:hypothetical protein
MVQLAPSQGCGAHLMPVTDDIRPDIDWLTCDPFDRESPAVDAREDILDEVPFRGEPAD